MFDPTRFLDEDGNLTPTPPGWIPFSAGRRVCLGETIAKPELLMVLATFLQQFDITKPDGEDVDLNLCGDSFTCKPKPFKIRMKCRK